jgi:hypothetical protein
MAVRPFVSKEAYQEGFVSQPSPFHVRIVQPAQVREVLRALYTLGGPIINEAILAENCGFRVNEPVLACRMLGLVEGRDLRLSPEGKTLVQVDRVKPSLFSEIVHFYYYSIWDGHNEDANRFSWSYAALCGALWESGISAINRGQLAARVADLAMDRFRTQKVSFSENSVAGVLGWLRLLTPPVLKDSEAGGRRQTSFMYRGFCPPETFVLALDFLHRLTGTDYQTNLLLDLEKQETICKVCLLEPTAFDTVLDWAIGQFPFLQQGSRGGWGRYVVLTRQPRITDFLG